VSRLYSFTQPYVTPCNPVILSATTRKCLDYKNIAGYSFHREWQDYSFTQTHTWSERGGRNNAVATIQGALRSQSTALRVRTSNPNTTLVIYTKSTHIAASEIVKTLVKTSKRRQNAELAPLDANNALETLTVKRRRSESDDLAAVVVSRFEFRAPRGPSRLARILLTGSLASKQRVIKHLRRAIVSWFRERAIFVQNGA
jgi:hypothetical protein